MIAGSRFTRRITDPFENITGRGRAGRSVDGARSLPLTMPMLAPIRLVAVGHVPRAVSACSELPRCR
jgi:hypothetical protein